MAAVTIQERFEVPPRRRNRADGVSGNNMNVSLSLGRKS
jgi:hypothetical protein